MGTILLSGRVLFVNGKRVVVTVSDVKEQSSGKPALIPWWSHENKQEKQCLSKENLDWINKQTNKQQNEENDHELRMQKQNTTCNRKI